ncbi:MAG: YgaP-like transmembrane domain [Trueperaceae bacterium]
MAGRVQRANVGPLERGLSLIIGATTGSAAARRRSPGAVLLGLTGAYLVYRGLTGRCAVYRALGVTGSEVGRTVSACSQITVQRPADEVYSYLRDLGNLARFSKLVKSVEPLPGGLWRFRSSAPTVGSLVWDARITVAEENRRIAWCSVEGAELPGAVDVSLTETPFGTELHVDAWLVPPVAPIVTALARRAERSRPLRRAGLSPSRLLQQELRRLRQQLEAGEIATVKGQSAARALHGSG